MTQRTPDSHSREVEDDRVEDRLGEILCVLVLTRLRTRVVPRSLTHPDLAHIDPPARVLLNVINEGIVEQGRVRVQDTLLETVHDDARRGRDDLDGRQDPRALLERNVHLTSLGWVPLLLEGDLTEEVTARVGETDKE